MDRILTYTIKPEQEGMQLLDFLRSKGFSRGILSSMKADKNAIQLNGEWDLGNQFFRSEILFTYILRKRTTLKISCL